MNVHPAQFSTAMKGGEYLSGIQLLRRIERAFDPLLLFQIRLCEHLAHQIAFFDAHAVLSGQDTADLHAKFQNLGPEFLGLVQFAGVFAS